MNSDATSLREFCEHVRFELDEPCSQYTHTHAGLADFVARVRASALQVTKRSVPHIYEAGERVREALRMRRPLELYVRNDPTATAYAPVFGASDRPVVVLHSGLVNLLSSPEIEFVIGHELGHLGLGHGADVHGPVGDSEFSALQARSQQRYKEVSADRIGLLAARSVFVATHVMVKLASGLPGDMIGMDVDAFVKQIERHPDEISREWELDQTHPSLPFRLWALVRFGASDVYSRLSGQGDGGTPLGGIDSDITSRLAAQGDGRLNEVESRIYTLAIVWAGMALIMDDDVIEPGERGALDQLVGPEHAMKVLAFADAHGKAAVEKKLEEAMRRLASSGLATQRRFQEAAASFAVSLGVRLPETLAGAVMNRTLRLQ